jgi:catechol 2,3-dioxygenase-like lactoylglutathione lyase family enzyme
MPIDHLGLAVLDFRKSRDFYVQALAPLGMKVVMESDGWVMFGKAGRGEFFVSQKGESANGNHIAFAAENRDQVRAFHDAAIAAGGRDNGAPGIRQKYHSAYYAAFIFDPDGNNIEAVCREPE